MKWIVLLWLACIGSTFAAEANVVDANKTETCQGKFLNPITDICWSCMFPIRVAGVKLMGENSKLKSVSVTHEPGGAEWGFGSKVSALPVDGATTQDISTLAERVPDGVELGSEDNTSSPSGVLCGCENPARVGVKMSFWEPTHLVEVVRAPFCFVSLGGVDMGKSFQSGVDKSPSLAKLFGGRAATDTPMLSNVGAMDTQMGGVHGFGFRSVHWFTNPVVFWLEAVMDMGQCLDRGAFDIGWISELDPTWKTPALSFIQAPESALFANVVAQSVCTADCMQTMKGFGFRSLFWCAGCQGGIYPYTGFFGEAGRMEMPRLMVQRVQSKLHRDFIAWRAAGEDALCRYRFDPLMDKRNYKMSMTYPVPARKVLGSCCEPFGRTTQVVDEGKAVPYVGEDFAYQLFRKRDCCVAYSYE